MADAERGKPFIKGQLVPRMQSVEWGNIVAEKARESGETTQTDTTLREPRPKSDNNKKAD